MQPNPNENCSEVNEPQMDESNEKISEKEDKGGDRDGDEQLMPQKVAQESEIPERCRSFTDWSSESASDRSVMEIDKGSQDNYRSYEPSNNINDRLENRIRLLERQVEVSELEIQSLRKQIVKEGIREQELSNQICSLKDERDAVRTKYEQLKLSPNFVNDVEALPSNTEDIRRENKKLRLRLQKTEDTNSELILAVRDLNEKLNQKNKDDKKAPKEHAADEIQELKRKIKDMYSEIDVHSNDKEELRIHVEDLSLDYEILRKENQEITSNLEKNQIENNKMQRQNSESLTNVKQLKLQVVRLEEEIRKGELQYSASLKMNKELETQIKSLAQELELQALDFEDEMEVVTRAKIEQENRAVFAEEALRKSKRDNTNVIERLQEEFTKISVEMASKIDENEKISTEAAAEADDLRLKNQILEELLQKTKEQYERKIQQLSDSINMDTEQRMKISEETEHEGIVRDEEYTKGSVHASDILKRWNEEKEKLEIEMSNVKKEAETLLDEKKKTEEKFQSELGKFRVQNDELRHHSVVLKTENENLQMEMIRLQTNLQRKKEENVSQKQVETHKSSNSLGKINRNMINIEELEENTEGMTKKKNGQTNDTQSNSKLLDEVTALTERNKHMEGELKEMQDRYSDISLKFAEVEGERQQLVMALRNLKSGKKQ